MSDENRSRRPLKNDGEGRPSNSFSPARLLITDSSWHATATTKVDTFIHSTKIQPSHGTNQVAVSDDVHVARDDKERGMEESLMIWR